MGRSITDIYEAYGIPEQLCLHMLRAAAVGALIADNWTGPPLDRSAIVRVLLLHDMGNLVKIEPSDARERDRREQFVARYGADDHEASLAIGRELGLGEAELALMAGKIFVLNDETATGDDFARKVSAYADQRIAPNGVLGLRERLEEARARYRDKPGSSMNNPRADEMISRALEIERQVAAFSRISLAAINDDSIAERLDALRLTEI